MGYYRSRLNYKQMSGEYMHLIGKHITWEETLDQCEWGEREGKVLIVHPRTKMFSVLEDQRINRGVWTDDPTTIRNVRVDGQVVF